MNNRKKQVYIIGGLYQPSGMGQVLSCKVNYLVEHYVVLAERIERKHEIFGPGNKTLYHEQVKPYDPEQKVSSIDTSECVYNEIASSLFYILCLWSVGFVIVLIEAIAIGQSRVKYTSSRDIVFDYQAVIFVVKNKMQMLLETIYLLIEHDKESHILRSLDKIDFMSFFIERSKLKLVILYKCIIGNHYLYEYGKK